MRGLLRPSLSKSLLIFSILFTFAEQIENGRVPRRVVVRLHVPHGHPTHDPYLHAVLVLDVNCVFSTLTAMITPGQNQVFIEKYSLVRDHQRPRTIGPLLVVRGCCRPTETAR